MPDETNGQSEDIMIQVPAGSKYVVIFHNPATGQVGEHSNADDRVEEYGLLGMGREIVQIKGAQGPTSGRIVPAHGVLDDRKLLGGQ